MKDIKRRLVGLLRSDYCTPQISRIAKRMKEPSATIHYNVKKLEDEGIIKAYKAVLDHASIGEGFCAFVLINLDTREYGDPETIAEELAARDEIESIDICTGDWELILKVRAADSETYYEFVKNIIGRKGVSRTKTLMTLKQVKSEYIIT